MFRYFSKLCMKRLIPIITKSGMVHTAQVSTCQDTVHCDILKGNFLCSERVNQGYSGDFLKRVGLLSEKCFCDKKQSLQFRVLLKVLSEELLSLALWFGLSICLSGSSNTISYFLHNINLGVVLPLV